MKVLRNCKGVELRSGSKFFCHKKTPSQNLSRLGVDKNIYKIFN